MSWQKHLTSNSIDNWALYKKKINNFQYISVDSNYRNIEIY